MYTGQGVLAITGQPEESLVEQEVDYLYIQVVSSVTR